MTKTDTTMKGGPKGKAGGSNIKLSAPETVRRVVKLYREDKSTSADALCLFDTINELLQYADADAFSPDFLPQALGLAARRVEHKSGRVAPAAEKAYKELAGILARLDNGETLAGLQAEAEQRRVEEETGLKGEEARRVKDEVSAHMEAAREYASTAHAAALAHFDKYHNSPFMLSRLPVVYGETNPGDVHMVVTLPGVARDRWVDEETVKGWITDAEMLARTLEHPDCTEAFKTAFGVIYTEQLLNCTDRSMEPTLLRILLPLVMLEGSGSNHSCEDLHTLRTLVLLSSELISDDASEAVREPLRDSRKGKGVRADA